MDFSCLKRYTVGKMEQSGKVSLLRGTKLAKEMDFFLVPFEKGSLFA